MPVEKIEKNITLMDYLRIMTVDIVNCHYI